MRIGSKLQKILHSTTKSIVSQAILDKTLSLSNMEFIELEVDESVWLSYLPTSKIKAVPVEDRWTSSLRRKARPISVLNKLCPNLSTTDTNNWLGNVRARVLPGELKIESTHDLRWPYDAANYISLGGNSILEKSCMRHAHRLVELDFYIPYNVKCVYVTKNGFVVARALLWNIHLDNKPVSVLDRIYDYKPEHGSFLRKWGEQHCTYIKDHPTHKFFNCKDNEYESIHFKIPLERVPKRTPYIDTFRYAYNDGEKRVLSNVYQPAGETLTFGNDSVPREEYNSSIPPKYVWSSRQETIIPVEKSRLLGTVYDYC